MDVLAPLALGGLWLGASFGNGQHPLIRSMTRKLESVLEQVHSESLAITSND